MEEFKALYLSKCKEFACEPITPFLEDLDAGAG